MTTTVCRCGGPKVARAAQCQPCWRAAYRTAFLARFWSKVDRSAGPDACWPWTGRRDKGGYGRVGNGLAHRMAYTLAVGPVEPGQVVRHRVCDNPPCCNPAHLAAGTYRDNSLDMASRGRAASQAHPERHARGTAMPQARLTDAAVVTTRRLTAAGVTQVALAEQFSVSRHTIYAVVKGLAWTHVQ